MSTILPGVKRFALALAGILGSIGSPGLHGEPDRSAGATLFYRVSVGPAVRVIEGGIFPYMFRTLDGTLIVQGSLVRPPTIKAPERNDFGAIPRTVRSTDGGLTWQTWTPPADPIDGPVCEGGWIQLRSGPILMFSWISEYRREGFFVGKRWQSNDDWQTVLASEETEWDVPGGSGAGTDDDGHPFAAICTHRSVLELPNGDLATAIYGRLKTDTAPSQYLKSMYRFRSIFMRSKDQGRTWKYVSTVAADSTIGQEGFNESVLLRLAGGEHPGRLICILRVGRQHPLYQVSSDDEGQTWSKAKALNLVGVDPDLIEMKDGVLACSFGHKLDCNDDGNFLAFSFDQGENWSQVAKISSGLTGAYTTVCELGPGKLFVVYDVRDHGSYHSASRRILGRTVRLEMAK